MLPRIEQEPSNAGRHHEGAESGGVRTTAAGGVWDGEELTERFPRGGGATRVLRSGEHGDSDSSTAPPVGKHQRRRCRARRGRSNGVGSGRGR